MSTRPGLIPQVAPCVVSHNMALGGAQTAILRMLLAAPDWVRERTTLYVQSDDRPLLDAAIEKHGFSVGAITTTPPADPSCWVLSYGKIADLPDPWKTEIGYVTGPGGAAVLYADGHVKWQDH